MAYLDENGLEHFWGKIKDHVSSAIAPKADDADVLHKTGTETVSGEKVFSGIQTTTAGNASALLVVKDPNLVKGDTPETNHYLSLGFIDSTGDSYAQDVSSRLAVVEYKSPSEANPEGYTQMADVGFNGGGTAVLRVGHDKDNVCFASAPATSDDRTNSTDIVTRGYMEDSEWNWQKTKKAGAVTLKPVPESDLEPVVDFLFTETPPAEGDKGPDNPSAITGVSSVGVGRLGKNIFFLLQNQTKSGVTCTINEDGSVTLDGTASETTSFVTYVSSVSSILGKLWFSSGSKINCYYEKISGTATVGSSNGFKVQMSCPYKNGTSFFPGANQDVEGVGATWIATNDFHILSSAIQIYQGMSFSNYRIKIQFELDSVHTNFENFIIANYTIQLGDTYYGGSLNVATGVMTVTHGMTEIGGSFSPSSQNFQEYTDCYRVGFVIPGKPRSPSSTEAGDTYINNYASDILPVKLNAAAANAPCISIPTLSVNIYIFFTKQMLGVGDGLSFNDLKPYIQTWLSSHPIHFVHLVDPVTIQLTPTQIRSLPALDKYEPRVNTVYTDQEAVQVGYQRFANYVDLTTDQTVEGLKTLSNEHIDGTTSVTALHFRNPSVTRGVPMSNGNVYYQIHFLDASGEEGGTQSGRLGMLQYRVPSTGGSEDLSLGCYRFSSDPADAQKHVYLRLGYRTDGIPYVVLNKLYIINTDTYDTLRRVADNGALFICSGSNFYTTNGSYIRLNGSQATTNPGYFDIFTGNVNSSYKLLEGRPDGTLTWDGQSIQTSSDERLKTPLSEVPDEVLDAWEDVNWGQFQYLDAVASKGESARLHLGLIAQHVMSVFERHGLDACDYGILCHEERPAVDKEETVTDVEAYVDGEGVEHPAVTHVETRHEDAVDLWMVRYAEAQAMEACCMRRENARLKKRIADLEERLAALELKIS